MSMSQPQIESLDAKTSTLTLSLDRDLYPRDVLYAAAYVFLDRAYVLLDRVGERYLVHVRAKQATSEAVLRDFVGELENELLAQALRLQVVRANQNIIEHITTLAIVGAGGDGGVARDRAAATGATDDGADFLDDPLGISKPWEPAKGDG